MNDKIRPYTFSALTEDSPGVLHRLTAVFTRRKINVESLCVAATGAPGISRFTIVINCDELTSQKLQGQIRRIVEVIEVNAYTEESLIYNELAYYRVVSDKREDIDEAVHVAQQHNAKILHLDEHFVVLEQIATNGKVSALYGDLEPLGLEEFVRSGRIAIGRHKGLFTSRQDEIGSLMNKRYRCSER